MTRDDLCTLSGEAPEEMGEVMAEPTYEEMKARLAELAERMNNAPLHFRVAQKGGVSVYGISRFPITLSYAQWVKLLEATPQLRAFMEENKSKLKLEVAP